MVARYSAKLAGADQEHAVLGAEGVGELGVVHLELVGGGGFGELHGARCERHRALHEPAFFEFGHQGVERSGVGVVFEQQFERAAAGQAEAVRLVGGDAVLHQRGRRAQGHVFAVAVRVAVARDQVVLDAAARDRTHHRAVIGQRHDRADRPRRRAPGAHHRGQERALAGLPPVAQRAQHHDIEIFHGVVRL
jgi:hypothetical protein